MNNITKSLFSEYIKGFKLQELFNYLGWNNDRTQIQPFKVDDVVYRPKIIADKNGFKIIECISESVPLYSIRAQILNLLRVKFAELMVIFTDSAKSRQVWLYGYRLGTQNKRAECEHRSGQDPQALYERAAGLFFSLDEEDNITIVDVTARVRSNFTQNAERVTKRFYNEFKQQHTALLGFIKGITANVDKEWYASIMLNRLMFCYFMQKRGFLNQDKHYLRNKLHESKERLGKGRFYSFYRSFLLTLFQKGFGTYDHTLEVVAMIGKIPYLNGGLFDLHEIERQYPDIDISDEAFEHIFDLFDRYEWHLDTRECASGNEISPDVLGYIFEKYINDRAAMGAYYTQEDITGYISRSTILPYLLEATKKAYSKPFEQDGAVWKFLQKSGDRYIFDSVKKGADAVLPDNIAIGFDTAAPNLIERRKDWNKPVPDTIDHLPTEIWREFIERTSRYRATFERITGREISDTTDFITYNLDIVSFVNDLLDQIEDPKFIQVFYAQLEKVTVLDPTCGSGAFLFAALNILEPLYDSCLSRMADYLSHNYKGMLERSTKRFFDEKLEQMESEIHPNKSYFIYKSIILNNLYGVDIMKEAVETAKLRLFLKLVSTAEPNYRADNIGIEPLPDIDFNIKAGNTLIGFANEQEVQDALNGNLIGMAKISETMDAMLQLSKAVSRYKQLQLGEGDYAADDFKAAKADLSARQTELRGKLDKLLRDNDYGSVSADDWQNNYQPFHWVSEFYSIIVQNGGFDVVIGNPPYVNYVPEKLGYRLINYTAVTKGNIYGHCIERSTYLCKTQAYISMICPMSLVKMPTYAALREQLGTHITYYAVFSADSHPGTLFDGVQQNVTIFVRTGISTHKDYSTHFIRFAADERPALLYNLQYAKKTMDNIVGNEIEVSVFDKLRKFRPIWSTFGVGENSVCMKNTSGAQFKVFFDEPPFFEINGVPQVPSTLTFITFRSENDKKFALALYNSCLFNLWWCSLSDGRHIVSREYECIPIFVATESIVEQLSLKTNALMENLQRHATRVTYNKANGVTEYDQYFPRYSKPIIDQIDIILAEHYGFTEEELDYIINYDIKYRMGLGGGGDDDE